MKNQKWKKVIGSLIAGSLLLGCLSACGNQKTDETKQSGKEQTKQSESTQKSESTPKSSETSVAEETGVSYPMEGNVKLTIGIVEEATVSAYAKDLAHTPFGEEWQKATGVEIEILSLANGQAMNLLLTSGDLPDIIWNFDFNRYYSGGAQQAISDGIVAPIGDYIEYAPDLEAVLNSNDLWRKAASLSNGTIWSAPQILSDDTLCVSFGWMLRKDWLDDLKMEIPETPEDLYEVLKAFKEKKGAEYPLSLTKANLYTTSLLNGVLTSPWGLANAGWYREGNTAHYGASEASYKGILEYLNKLYEEELLDPNFQTLDANTQNANFMNGVSGVTAGAVGSEIGTYLTTMEATDPNFDIAGFGPLVAQKGDTALMTKYTYPITNGKAVITQDCKNKEAAAQFLNYGYTEEGKMLFNFGVEGTSYNMINDYPTYTDLITKNADGMTMVQALGQYTRAQLGGPYVQDKTYFEQYSNRPQQQQAVATWSKTTALDYVMPPLLMSAEDSGEFSAIMGDINTYVAEMFIAYVTGEKSLDTFESEYLAQLKTMGIERAIELEQKALDEFNSR